MNGSSIHIIDSGKIGQGKVKTEERYPYAASSGSAVFDNPSAIKMMISLYPCSTETFIRHHGEEGARTYLRIAREGLHLQQEIAHQLDFPLSRLHQLGSLYVCFEKDREEYRFSYKMS